MASNYTENYQLPLWAADDAFLRSEFNDANQKIDGAIAAGFRPGNLPWVTGSYTGNGTAQTIELGFRPSALFIYATGQTQNHQEQMIYFDWGAKAYGAYRYTFTDGTFVPTLLDSVRTDQGFSLSETQGAALNYSGTTYYYLALK